MLLYACSTNAGKLREFALAAAQQQETGLSIERLPNIADIEAPEETGHTFTENASLKALYYSQFTPEWVFADDSGLEVDALGKQPGVYSARYAGPNATDAANNRLVLERLADQQKRRGRFVCVIALARAGELITTVTGTVEGEILDAPRGSNGFGYDPLFYYEPLGCSFGELRAEDKWAVSHRGNAFRSLLTKLQQLPAVNGSGK